MYDELVKRLRNCVESDCAKCLYQAESPDAVYMCFDLLMVGAADAIEELSKRIKAVQCVNIGDLDCDSNQLCTCMGIVRKRLEAAEKKLRWISVTERLPENCADVLAYIERNAYGEGDVPYRKREIAIAYHVNGLWHVDGCSGVDCIAWMPLPEPPKEGEDHFRGATKMMEEGEP